MVEVFFSELWNLQPENVKSVQNCQFSSYSILETALTSLSAVTSSSAPRYSIAVRRTTCEKETSWQMISQMATILVSEEGGWGQALHLADEDRRHHQHRCQVHAQGRLEEEQLQEACGVGDHRQQGGSLASYFQDLSKNMCELFAVDYLLQLA